MKTPSNDLFSLIQSLDKNERRYFKLFIQNLGAKESHYHALFDAISRQKEYNESKIKAKFRKEKFIKRFSAVKQYLFELILRALRNYHTNRSIEDEILDGLRNTKILLNKGLFPLLVKEIARIEKLAVDYDKVQYLPNILALKTAASIAYPTKNKSIAEFQEGLQTWRASVDYLKECTEQHSYNLLATFSQRKQPFPSSTPCPIPTQEGLTLHLRFLSNLITQAFYKKDLEECFNIWKRTEELCKKEVHYLNDKDIFGSYILFIVTLINYYSYQPSIKKFKHIKSTYDSLDQDRIPLKTQLYIFNCILRSYRNMGLIIEGKQTIVAFNRFLSKHKSLKKYHTIPITYYEVSIVHIIEEDYDKALDLLAQCISLIKFEKTYYTLFLTTKIIEIIIFYQKKEFIVLSSFIDSLQRKIDSKDELYSLAKRIIGLFKKLLLHQTNTKKCLHILEQTKEEFIVLKNTINPNLFFYYFPYIEWIDSQLTAKPLYQILQEKAGIFPTK